MKPQEATMPAISMLIIDDNPSSLELLSSALAHSKVEILTATNPREGLELVFAKRPQIILTDLVMPEISGLEVLERVMEFDPAIEVILITAHYTSETAVEAIKKGASDYLNKPIPIATLRERLDKLVQDIERRRGSGLEPGASPAGDFEGLAGNTPVMWDMFSRIRRVAPHFRTVLITGETGTGKELVARALYRLSPATAGKFVVLNCSAVVETLFESELFGHTRGAFTGATADKPGLFEHAHGGVLFLDEIGDMPLGTQAKLLRVLQNQEILRVGSLQPRRVDVLVIAATNKDLRASMANKSFREDLFYRISMVEIKTPRLSDRKDDLPLLERRFLTQFASQYGKPYRSLTPRAHMVLAQHDWPGNVRELENALGHAVMMAHGDSIDVEDLPGSLHQRLPASTIAYPSGSEEFGAIETQERQLVIHAMEESGGNQSRAARLLRIGRDALRYKLRKYSIPS